VNGRISDRSFRGYSRALRWFGRPLRRFLVGMLSDAMLFLMQSAEDAARITSLGAPSERVLVTGNLKYDLALPSANPLAAWLAGETARSGRKPLLIAGSVVAGEEIAVLQAYAAVIEKWPSALLVLAPRKPERFDAAAKLVEESGWHMVRRSALTLVEDSSAAITCAAGKRGSVLLLDSIGELASLYALADAVFIGGSLEPTGGHNPLEAAAAGKPPVFGPAMQNFRDIAKGLLAAEGAMEVRSGAELGAVWNALVADPERGARMGRAAQALVEQNRGAAGVAVEWAARLLERSDAPAVPVAATFSAVPQTGRQRDPQR